MAEDKSNVQPGGPIRKHPSLVEVESQLCRVVCDLVHRDTWLGAMRQELQRLMGNNTFDTAELTAGRKPIPAKWVFTWKQNHDGRKVVMGKTRFVERELLHNEGMVSGDTQPSSCPIVYPDYYRYGVAAD